MKLKGGENMNLKAQAGGMAFLATFAIGFVIAGIYLTLGSDITNELSENYYYLNNTETNESLPAVWEVVPTNEAAYNITNEMQTGAFSLAERMPLIALVVGIVIVLGFLVMVKI